METERVRDVMWQPVNDIGLESCGALILHLPEARTKAWVLIAGKILGIHEGSPFFINYDFDLHSVKEEFSFHISCSIAGKDSFNTDVYITTGDGKWWNHRGNSVPKFDGCLAIYIAQTPSTATYALQHLALSVGQSGQLKVMSVDALIGSLTPEIHRYTCLERNEAGGTYKCENLTSGIETSFSVDVDNLVIDYHNQFRRVWSNTETA
jgi:hypothetical protein